MLFRSIRRAQGRSSIWRRHLPPTLLALALACAVFSLARPMAKVTLPSDHMTLILTMDVSRSMLAQDVEPSRIEAAQAAARYNNDNRLKEESQLVDYFRQQGLQIQTPDVAAFRAAVQQAYMQSDYANVWPSGLLDRINAVR